MSDMFEPKNQEERMIASAVGLVMDMQFAVQVSMKKRGINQRKLAKLMGCTASNISQMLADDANPRVETIAKALAAMGEKFIFASESLHGDWIATDFDRKALQIRSKNFQKISRRENRELFDIGEILQGEMPKSRRLKKLYNNKANDNSWLMGSKVKELSKLLEVA